MKRLPKALPPGSYPEGDWPEGTIVVPLTMFQAYRIAEDLRFWAGDHRGPIAYAADEIADRYAMAEPWCRVEGRRSFDEDPDSGIEGFDMDPMTVLLVKHAMAYARLKDHWPASRYGLQGRQG